MDTPVSVSRTPRPGLFAGRYCSSITLAELRYGADIRRSRKLHGLIDAFAEPMAVVPFDRVGGLRTENSV